MKKLIHLASILSAITIMSACGGGDDPGTAAPLATAEGSASTADFDGQTAAGSVQDSDTACVPSEDTACAADSDRKARLNATAAPSAAIGSRTVEFNLPGLSIHSFSPLACATEGRRCTVEPNTTVAYGAGNQFSVRVHSGTFACTNAAMGSDPAPGQVKACYVSSSHFGTKQVERLNRGAIAIKTLAGHFIGWRLLGTEPRSLAFNVYGTDTSTGNTAWRKLTAAPIANATNFMHSNPGNTRRYRIVPVLWGNEQMAQQVVVVPQDNNFIDIPVTPPVTTTPNVTYRASEASPGDLRGTGSYDLVVKWEPSNAKDSETNGDTDKTYLDAYTFSGTPRRLWRIDLGINIRSGAHYTPFVVYDLNGDGKAEVAVRTAQGSVDGSGAVLNRSSTDPRTGQAVFPDERDANGRVLTGQEWLTVFDGATGRRIAQTPFAPGRGPRADWKLTWGDDWGNRMDRFNAGVAYLNGTTPSLIMQRGYYERTVVAAWDLNGSQLKHRWTFDTHNGITKVHPGYAAQGAHHLVAADLDHDGRDEIVLGAAVIGHDGKPFNTTGRGHGDVLQVGDFDPTVAGLEVFTTHEKASVHGGAGLQLRSGHNAAEIWKRGSCDGRTAGDVGRGMILDLDPSRVGAEAMGSGDGSFAQGIVYADGTGHSDGCATGAGLARNPMAIHWDGDVMREFVMLGERTRVTKWWPNSRTTTNIFQVGTKYDFSGAEKAQPMVVADLYGDWREEMAVFKPAGALGLSRAAIRIYTTTTPTQRFMADGVTPVPAIPTLMHDPQYRAAVASQNSSYNQTPNPSFYLGDGMTAPVVRRLHTR